MKNPLAFGPHHYVPILKVKANEKWALGAIAPSLRKRITPLMEIVRRVPLKKPTVAAHLETAFKDLAAAVRLYRRCFLDTRELEVDGPTAAEEVFRRALGERMTFTPVTGISRSVDVEAALQHRVNGTAIRLTREEFENGTVPKGLPSFMSKHSLRAENVDLILDIGDVGRELIAEGIANLVMLFLAAVPDLPSWRTVTVSGSSFPLSMGILKSESHDFVERSEWVAWRDEFHGRRTELTRLPTFSDCAIQHPKGVEEFDPRTMQVAAAIRYALPDRWLLIKGISTRREKPGPQFRRLARKLVSGECKAHFAGKTHCQGCADASQTATAGPDDKACCSAGSWRRIGTIHHITQAMEGLATLPWP